MEFSESKVFVDQQFLLILIDSFLDFKKRCSWFPTEKETQNETHEKQKRKELQTVTVYPAASSCYKTRSYFTRKKKPNNFHKAFPLLNQPNQLPPITATTPVVVFQDGFDQCYKMHEIVGGIGGKTRVLVASLRDVVNMQVLAQKGAVGR